MDLKKSKDKHFLNFLNSIENRTNNINCVKNIIDVTFFLEEIDFIDKKIENLQSFYPGKSLITNRLEAEDKNIENFNEKQLILENISLLDAENLYIKLNQKKFFYEEKINKIKEELNYDFVDEVINYFIEKKDFNLINYFMKYELKYNSNPIINYVNNLSFEKLIEDINDNNFVKLLKSNLTYEKTTEIQFNNFSQEQNIELSKNLLLIYQKDHKKEYSYNFLYYFKKENRNFIKKFAIENIPQHLFYSYDFLPIGSETYKPTNLIQSEYTVEEIFKAFQNLEKTLGFFSEQDINANYTHFFQYSLFKNGKFNNDDKYKELLSLAKEKNNKLYTLLINQSTFSTIKYEKQDEDYKTKDESANKYFKDVFDLDVVLKGLKEITLDCIKKENLNNRLISGSIFEVIKNTYFDKWDDYCNSSHSSLMTKDETIKIMKFLFENAPMHFIGINKLGITKNIEKFFIENINEIITDDNIKLFLFSNNNIHCEYYKINSKDSGQYEKLINIFCAIIENYVDKKNNEIIDYLKETFEKHRSLDNITKRKIYENININFLNILSNNEFVNSLLLKSQLKISLDKELQPKKVVKNKIKNKV